ncbi:MAG TPA: DUF4167 domain-containing protein [Amaricoccus sp.]|jgi:hypothetical protein|nr:DUF4167 domain-containing protein [Amaricoccus sp.]
MRPSNKSRSRNKPGGGGGGNGNHQNNQRQRMGNIINRVFESAGPDGKVRGTPQQIIDKYQALARDAQVSGDRVAAESYLQHSEHYSRLLGEAQRQQVESRFQQQEREDAGGPRGDDGFERERRPQQPMPVASGLTTIDADDGDYPGGPIETPEERRSRRDEPAPVVLMAPRVEQPQSQPQPAPQPLPEPQVEARDGADAPVAAEPPVAEPPAKRSRPRRRPKAEAPAADAPAQAE